MQRSGLLTLGLGILSAEASSTDELCIDAAFPGGNIIVERIEGNDVYVCQDLRDTAGDWFYWCFRARGGAGRRITVHFSGSNVIGVHGPAMSIDEGVTWSWLGADAVQGKSFSQQIPTGQNDVRFSFGMPYMQTKLEAFLQRHGGNPALRKDTLCRTRAGRDVELLHLGKLKGTPDHRVLLTCRHHCCEMMASYALEGIMDTILGDSDDGAWFREHAEFLVVPFADKDGVEQGDQGKNRKPRDHNRDYDGDSIYASTAALRRHVPEWAGNRLRFAMDMHCPHIRGPSNEVIYFVGMEDPGRWARTQQFSQILETTNPGLLPYSAANNLPYGQGWNVARNYGGGMSCSRWAGSLPGIRFAASLEIPYANAGGQPVTQTSAHAFGKALAHAIRAFLEE